MEAIRNLNKFLREIFANASTFVNAVDISDIDKNIRDIVCSRLPAILSQFLGSNSVNYKIKGSVGAGKATKTPWIAIMDKEITETTRKGVYIVFLFSSDYKHVYLTLNQGTTVPGQFGPRLKKKDIMIRTESIRNLMDVHYDFFKSDNNADIADERYKAGAIYYTLWNIEDEKRGKDILNLYLDIYKKYKKINLSSCETVNKGVVKILRNDFLRNRYTSYITAIKSKPFLLLAGISGTGKSRIVRELARACWDKGTKEYEDPKPRNFEMIQVKPNWHDSSELIGYVSRVGGEPRFVAGDFLRFIAKAWMDENTPYFLCLDEMNLAPVEQYFAEYLSVIETRKRDDDGNVITDPILKKSDEDWYRVLTAELTIGNEFVRNRFLKDGITIPQNLIVIGTVNMDETTFSFSRKVLDRAMTIEMNEVDLYGGLMKRHENIGKLEREQLIGIAVEGVDVYSANKEVCDKVLAYLTAVNGVLERTPFKVAYRTRNEFLLYVVNNLPYNKDENGNYLDENNIIARTLDEITSMKILSRIEGDEMKIGSLLTDMRNTISEQLNVLSDRIWIDHEEEGKERSVSLAKLMEMEKRLRGGYTSFWS